MYLVDFHDANYLDYLPWNVTWDYYLVIVPGIQ